MSTAAATALEAPIRHLRRPRHTSSMAPARTEASVGVSIPSSTSTGDQTKDPGPRPQDKPLPRLLHGRRRCSEAVFIRTRSSLCSSLPVPEDGSWHDVAWHGEKRVSGPGAPGMLETCYICRRQHQQRLATLTNVRLRLRPRHSWENGTTGPGGFVLSS